MSALASVYAHLAGATILTGVASQFPLIPQNNWLIILLEVLAILVITFILLSLSPGPFKYGVFAVYIFLIGNLLSPLTQILDEKDLLAKVLAMTAGIFLGMTVLASLLPGRFLGFGPFLFAGLIGLILARIGVWIAGFADAPQNDLEKTNTILSYVGTALFAVFVAYDTQVLKTRMGSRLAKKDPINATVGLYLDIINLYTSLSDITE